MRPTRPIYAVVLLVSACSSTPPPADMTVKHDLLMLRPNPVIGTLCDSEHFCPNSALLDGSTEATRCAVVLQGDQVGLCSADCGTDYDCATDLPGLSLCEAGQCVLFCGPQKQCPTDWSCVATLNNYICRPPQTPLPVPDMAGTHPDLSGPADMSVSDMQRG